MAEADLGDYVGSVLGRTCSCVLVGGDFLASDGQVCMTSDFCCVCGNPAC